MPSDTQILFFSDRRWSSPRGRPQQLMRRAAQEYDVWFFEPVLYGSQLGYLRPEVDRETGIHIVTPHLPEGMEHYQSDLMLESYIEQLVVDNALSRYILWHETADSLRVVSRLAPVLRVGDWSLDGRSGLEQKRLMKHVDLVLARNGAVMQAAKQVGVPAVLAPDGLDLSLKPPVRRTPEARQKAARVGFYGVLNASVDLDILRGIADARPHWDVILLAELQIPKRWIPQRSNIHNLGAPRYEDLGMFLSEWDVAVLPYKTACPNHALDCLAAGVPVVATQGCEPLLGDAPLVAFAGTLPEFLAACDRLLLEDTPPEHEKLTAYMRQRTWDKQWRLAAKAIQVKVPPPHTQQPAASPAVAPDARIPA